MRSAISDLRSSWRWFILAMIALAIAFVPIPAYSAPPQEHVFRVEARSFAYSPAILRVNPHDRVTIELVSTDVVHGVHIDGYDLEVIADPGQTQTLSFVADQAGTFRFRCSVTCGALHPFMIGKFQVGPNLLLWRSAGLALLAALAGAWRLRR